MAGAVTHARLASALLLGLAGLPAAPASAQPPGPSQGLIERDGSLGSSPAGAVGGGFDGTGRRADYLITPDLGEQHGGHLFHSFWRFGIGQGETATVTGPDPIDGPQTVEHVISRVTGPDASQPDGTLRSTIDGAAVSFAVRGPGGVPAEPDRWPPATLLPDAGAALAGEVRARSRLVASIAGPRIAREACP